MTFPKAVGLEAMLRAYLWARLGVAAVLLLLGRLLPGDLMPGSDPRLLSLALLVAVASSGALLAMPPPSQATRLARLLCLLDVVLVTSVVAATGGARSIYAFLYVLAVTAGCVLLSRTGGLVMAAASTGLYAAIVFGRTIFPLTQFFETSQETTALEILTIFLNSGTFVIVAFVAGGLAERFVTTHAALEGQRRDLRDLKAFKDLVFQSVSAGLVALDRQHVITAFNRAAENLARVPATAAIGKPWKALFGTAIPLEAVETVIVDARMSSTHEIRLDRADGTSAPVRVTFSALQAGDGRRVGLIAVCEDLSDIREMEARVRRADRLASLGRLSANIAHEIRNPLASLTGAVQALAGDVPAEDLRDRLRRIVLRESDRLDELLANFLDYAQPAPLSLVDIDVAELLDELLALVEQRSQPGRLKIVREFSPGLRWRIDPQQVRRAVWNLCLHALHSMPDGGELRVAAGIEHSRLVVRVADTGTGVDTGDLLQVFEPFSPSTMSASGLGLALAYRIVQEHGGDLDARSAPGAGTTFVITLAADHG